MSRPKTAIPLSTFTRAEWFRPGDGNVAHRLKVDPSGFTCQVSLCGLVVPEGAGEPWEWQPAKRGERCTRCERAAAEGVE